MLQPASPESALRPFTGILLAAGRGARFDPTGGKNKLLQPLASGDAVAVMAARSLLGALPTVLAVVRPGSEQLASLLSEAGCQVEICPAADTGMGASLVHAVSCARDANGWLIALADMPYVQPATIRMLFHAVEHGAQIAVPTCAGRRGNPVAFGRNHLSNLLSLGGDEGARRLLRDFPVRAVATDDTGIFRDIDSPADLRGEPAPR